MLIFKWELLKEESSEIFNNCLYIILNHNPGVQQAAIMFTVYLTLDVIRLIWTAAQFKCMMLLDALYPFETNGTLPVLLNDWIYNVTLLGLKTEAIHHVVLHFCFKEEKVAYRGVALNFRYLWDLDAIARIWAEDRVLQINDTFEVTHSDAITFVLFTDGAKYLYNAWTLTSVARHKYTVQIPISDFIALNMARASLYIDAAWCYRVLDQVVLEKHSLYFVVCRVDIVQLDGTTLVFYYVVFAYFK